MLEEIEIRKGFTLVELLVVIAIIGVVGLDCFCGRRSKPSERRRLNSVTNNSKQIAWPFNMFQRRFKRLRPSGFVMGRARRW